MIQYLTTVQWKVGDSLGIEIPNLMEQDTSANRSRGMEQVLQEQLQEFLAEIAWNKKLDAKGLEEIVEELDAFVDFAAEYTVDPQFYRDAARHLFAIAKLWEGKRNALRAQISTVILWAVSNRDNAGMTDNERRGKLLAGNIAMVRWNDLILTRLTMKEACALRFRGRQACQCTTTCHRISSVIKKQIATVMPTLFEGLGD